MLSSKYLSKQGHIEDAVNLLLNGLHVRQADELVQDLHRKLHGLQS